MRVSNLETVYQLINKGSKLGDKFEFYHPEKTKSGPVKLSLGKIWFNLLLPDRYPLVKDEVNKKKLNKIITDIVNKFGPEEASNVVSKIYREAFKLSSLVPITFQFEYLSPPKELIEKRDELVKKIERNEITSPEKVEAEINKLRKEYEKWLEENDVLLYYAMKGGAKGNISDWTSMTLARGYTVDVLGNVQKKPILKGMNEGYSPDEVMLAANQARRALYLQSTHAADPGYLARKVTFACNHLEIRQEDCGTNSFWKLHVSNDKIASSIIGRYYKLKASSSAPLKKVEKAEDVLNKTIYLRSPLYCKTKDGFCSLCYGDLYKLIDSKRVGLIAGSIINNVLMGVVLKAKHMMHLTQIQKVNFKEVVKDPLYSKYFKIKENEIYTKYPCKVVINLTDYKDGDYEILQDRIVLPGIITVEFESDEMKPVTLPIPFKVNLIKTPDTEETENVVIIKYDKGDLMIEQKYVNLAPSFSEVEQLIEARSTYINNPELLTLMIHELITRAQPVDLCHLEVIVSNMFRCEDNPRIHCRLKDYKCECKIFSQSKIPHLDSWLTSIAFQHIDNALDNALLNPSQIKVTPIERVILSKLGTDEE